ncbi:hypothetical protein [Gemmobacter nectariphilus]|uniref:hypothetical protein n=1 Tax=Gemmobacter nectariphilus TaxID=220343 RepID=UPI0012B655E7|nr:hypothetical protein [Gemmobacter nectariphilus]
MAIPTDDPRIRIHGERQSENNIQTRYPVRYGALPRVARVSTVDHPPAADPSDPFEVSRSHLMKMELGKSSSSCKVSLVTRLLGPWSWIISPAHTSTGRTTMMT